MKKIRLADDRFSRDYKFLTSMWVIIGVFDLLFIELPNLVIERNGLACLGITIGLFFLAGGFLMLHGRKLGIASIALAVIIACVRQYLIDGWAGLLTLNVISSILSMIALMILTLMLKIDGRTAWSLLK